MAQTNELSNLSLEVLAAKQKSLAIWQKIFIATAFISVGSVLYAVYMKTKMHPWWILGALFFILNNGSKLKKVEAEIETRKN